MRWTILNDRKVVEMEVDGINTRDYPDFCDAFITSATWDDTGEPLTEPELAELNEDTGLVYDLVIDRLY